MKHTYSKANQYAERNIESLDEAGNHYLIHIDAMTVESLHSKSEIAAELAYRDMRIENKQKTIIEQADKLKALTSFADWVLDATVSGSDICGGDAQNKMHEVGILTREIYNPEIHTLQQGCECEDGDYIYFKSSEL